MAVPSPAVRPSSGRTAARRCAIYTRKSSEEGLEQEFNSLDAQREACEAYIASQRAEGWILVPDRYDDGGVSGGTLERPALKRLLAVPRDLWDKVHAILGESPRKRASNTRAQTPALLKGLIFAPDGSAMTPTHTRKAGRLYRYYVSTSVLKQGKDACTIGRVPAGEIEGAVVDQVRRLLRQPEIVARTARAAREHHPEITEPEVREALHGFDALWDELFPAEQARIVGLLVERVDVGESGIDIRLRTEGLASLVQDLRAVPAREAA